MTGLRCFPKVTQTAIKPEPNGDPSRPDFIPTGNPTDDRSLFFGNWGPPYIQDPYQQLSTRIINFFYPPDVVISPESAGMNLYFSPENVKDFLERYTHFHVHFSMLHIPTFRIMSAYTGLLASMCCIGACYSDRVSPDHVRDMMNFLKTALERDSRILASLSNGVQDEFAAFGSNKADIEELQALMLLHVLLTWNGTPAQRESAGLIWVQIANLARKADLLRVHSSPSLFSPLHQPNFSLSTFDPSTFTFDWVSWAEQETRVRIMCTLIFCDAALGLYFNSPPLFSPFEVQVPLPCDDAAWDAPDATTCAEALGLHGPDKAKLRNSDGTQRAKQPELYRALRALLDSSYQIQPGTTNLLGKFILIHCLIAVLRRAQTDGSAGIVSGSATPLSQNDWVVGVGHDGLKGSLSNNSSGRGTPVDGIIPPHVIKTLATALDKFKHNWDTDMIQQFPPSSGNPRRYGFSKDAIHFYWLANYLLKNTRPAELQMAPDQRFTRVIHLLKSVRAWVLNDGASRGEDLGSVGDIDKDYGVMNLTLDMAQLFKPLPQVVESPGITSVKTEIA